MSQIATIGGGCYWCVEAIFQRVQGVEKVVSGYSGGQTERPTPADVYRGDTGHAEVVQITFDPAISSYRELLEIFFYVHDPTQLNRQGVDVGDEYRSVIFYHDEEQLRVAKQAINEFAPTLWDGEIVTQLAPFQSFWETTESMQDYYNRNKNAAYCQIVIEPKLAKFRQKYLAKLKPNAA